MITIPDSIVNITDNKNRIISDCAVPDNIHTPPQKRLEFPGGWGVL